jgi:(S)-citramalyl-CoA lyase
MTTEPTPRSWLFTPATRPERFAKGAESGADVLILDLEDAVAPGDKGSARHTAIQYLSSPAPILRALRVNPVGAVAGLTDLAALLQSAAAPDYVVLPKVGSPAEVALVASAIAESGKTIRLIGLVESAAGLLAVASIATAPGLAGLFFGAADMAAELGTAPAWAPLAYARSAVVAACAAAGLLAIDSPFFSPRDEAGLQAEVAMAIDFGFGAKAAIHPAQVAAINAAFRPSAAAIAQAHRILEENAKGVGVVDGQMIDEAIARKARAVLRAAERPPVSYP